MTDLVVRKMRFGFAESEVPFSWNESNRAFSSTANAMSFVFPAIEKMITTAVSESMALISEPEIAAEADAFLRQEGQHSAAHRQHVKALTTQYPDLKGTFETAMAMFDDLTASEPLKYRLAYIADMESTFTPSFKLMLDNADTLFAPGDDRVASLFIWHFVEEVEHRSSALRIYDTVIGDPWYRMRVAPSVFAHISQVMIAICEDFNKHVPLVDRQVDAMWFAGSKRWQKALRRRLSLPALPDHGPYANAWKDVRLRELLAAMYGIVRSQIPGHDPARTRPPVMAAEWHARYVAGEDLSRWYTATRT